MCAQNRPSPLPRERELRGEGTREVKSGKEEVDDFLLFILPTSDFILLKSPSPASLSLGTLSLGRGKDARARAGFRWLTTEREYILMYWWRIEPLKAELISGGPAESEKVKYLLATSALYVLASEGGYLAAQSDSIDKLTAADWISSISLIVLTFLGTYYCYRRNRGANGRQFLERFVCLGWPVTIRFLVFLVALLLGYAILGHVIGGERFATFFQSDEIVMVGVTVLWEILFFWYLGRHIHDIAERTAQGKAADSDRPGSL